METSSAEKERLVKGMQEMFSHLDPDVIHIVLSECDYKGTKSTRKITCPTYSATFTTGLL